MQITEAEADRLLKTVLPPFERGGSNASIFDLLGTIVLRAAPHNEIRNMDAFVRKTASRENRYPKKKRIDELLPPELPGRSASVLDDLIARVDQQALLSALADLPPKQRNIVLSAFGAFGVAKQKINNIARSMNLSEARIRQIRDQGISKLRQYFAKRGLLDN